jgi:hypothetical protein
VVSKASLTIFFKMLFPVSLPPVLYSASANAWPLGWRAKAYPAYGERVATTLPAKNLRLAGIIRNTAGNTVGSSGVGATEFNAESSHLQASLSDQNHSG